MPSGSSQSRRSFNYDTKSVAMPKPRPGRAGSFRAIFWAIIALCLVGGAAWWLLRAPEEKENLRAEAAEMINDAVSGTPLAGIGDIIRDTPPPPPQVINPPTARGTLAGRNVTGVVAAPVDVSPTPENDASASISRIFGSETSPQQGPTFNQEPLPPVTEDSKVRPGHLVELAQWLASRYRPGPAGGTLAMSVQSLNQVCGIRLADKAQGGRSGLLRYAFHPAMLTGLYNLYIDRFMTDLNAAATRQGMDSRQNRQFHLALAGRASLMAAALDGIMQVPDLSGKLTAIDNLAQQTVELNGQLANAMFELDELREAKAPATQVSTLRMRIDGITARYRRTVDDHAKAQHALTAEIRKYGGQSLDNDSLLFMAAWVERRYAADTQAGASLQGCADILRDLAKRCAQAGANS